MLLTNGIQHIARAGDMREINLGFDLVGRGATSAGCLELGMVAIPGLQISAHLFGFMLFERTGMGFLLDDSDVRERIENTFAFYFQLSCQIVNSNLTHPPLFSSRSRYVFILILTVVDFAQRYDADPLFRSVGGCVSLG